MSIKARFHINRDNFSLDVDLTIAYRGVTALFGPSGCGKTTLLRAIAGLEYSHRGHLQIGDELWQSPNRFVPPHKRSVGYVFQEPSLFAHLNVRRNIEYGLKRQRRKAQEISMDQATELLGIGHLLTRMPHQLSGGEQQRVAIARALAPCPAILLLDEPLASLDDRRKLEILPYLDSLHRKLEIPVIYVSHSRDEVARMADYLILLKEGQVEAAGQIGALFSRLDLMLAHEADAESIIEAKVTGHDDMFGLTRLDFPGGQFSITSKPLPMSTSVRLRVRARDVSITLAQHNDTSILNIIPATIDQIAEERDSQVTVRMMMGPTPILSRITRRSSEHLGLKPGKKIYAQVKSVALLT